MYKREIDRLYDIGVINEDLYQNIRSSMEPNRGGYMIGVVPSYLDMIYHLKFDPREADLKSLVLNSIPWAGAIYDCPDLFGKYYIEGNYSGIWLTDKNITEQAKNNGYKSLDSATELELLRMLFLINTYWMNFYKERVDEYRKR